MERLRKYDQQRRERKYMEEKTSILGNLFLVLWRGPGNQMVYRCFITGYGCLWKTVCVFLSCVDLPQCSELGIFCFVCDFFRNRYVIIDMHVNAHCTPRPSVFYDFSWEPGTRSQLLPSLHAFDSPLLHLSRKWQGDCYSPAFCPCLMSLGPQLGRRLSSWTSMIPAMSVLKSN